MPLLSSKSMPSVSTTDMSQAITSEQWERVVGLCQSKPDSAKSWTTRQGLFEGIKDSNVLPIHEALVGGAPLEVIRGLLNAYPDSISAKESSYKRLPLHCACRKNAILQVVELLLDKNPEAALVADKLGRLPIHYALSNGANDAVINALLKRKPDAARGFDNRGWTPLHVACGVGASTRVIKMLLSSYPEATMMKTQKGSSPQQCLNLTLCKNKDEVLKLLKRHYRKVDEKYKPAAKPDSDRVLV